MEISSVVSFGALSTGRGKYLPEHQIAPDDRRVFVTWNARESIDRGREVRVTRVAFPFAMHFDICENQYSTLAICFPKVSVLFARENAKKQRSVRMDKRIVRLKVKNDFLFSSSSSKKKRKQVAVLFADILSGY